MRPLPDHADFAAAIMGPGGRGMRASVDNV
jgi:hypothetical protein